MAMSEDFHPNAWVFLHDLLRQACQTPDEIASFADLIQVRAHEDIVTKTKATAADSCVAVLRRHGALHMNDEKDVIRLATDLFLYTRSFATWEQFVEIGNRHDIRLPMTAPAVPTEDVLLILESRYLSLGERYAFVRALESAADHPYVVGNQRCVGTRLHLHLRAAPNGGKALTRLGAGELTRRTGRKVRRVVVGTGGLVTLALCGEFFRNNMSAGLAVTAFGVTVTVIAIATAGRQDPGVLGVRPECEYTAEPTNVPVAAADVEAQLVQTESPLTEIRGVVLEYDTGNIQLKRTDAWDGHANLVDLEVSEDVLRNAGLSKLHTYDLLMAEGRWVESQENEKFRIYSLHREKKGMWIHGTTQGTSCELPCRGLIRDDSHEDALPVRLGWADDELPQIRGASWKYGLTFLFSSCGGQEVTVGGYFDTDRLMIQEVIVTKLHAE